MLGSQEMGRDERREGGENGVCEEEQEEEGKKGKDANVYGP